MSQSPAPAVVEQLPGSYRSVPIMKALLYCEWDAALWRAEGIADRRSGQAPYGLENLAAGSFQITAWQPSMILRGPLAKRLRLALEFEYSRPFVHSLLLTRPTPRPDVAIATLEDQGYAHALLKSLKLSPWADIPLVLVSCWMAEHARTAADPHFRLLRRIAQAADLIVYWSTNQERISREVLGVAPDRLLFVPFGVEAEFYRPRPATKPGGYVFTAGRDIGRDYETLFAAAAQLDRPVKVLCRPSRLEGLNPSANVELVGEVGHRLFRDLLWGADVIALASKPEYAYPTGQTVLLNAMSVGRPTVVTAAAPLADYT